MIKSEIVKFGKHEFIHTYSDQNKKIIQNETKIIYDEAYDIDNRYTYEETEEMLGTD